LSNGKIAFHVRQDGRGWRRSLISQPWRMTGIGADPRHPGRLATGRPWRVAAPAPNGCCCPFTGYRQALIAGWCERSSACGYARETLQSQCSVTTV
jgi:hypothetical protein